MKSKKKDERIFYVYEHYRPDTGACFYVGKGYGFRKGSMSKRSLHHRNIQAKLARRGLEVSVRTIKTDLTEEEAFSLERERIRHWRELGVVLTNQTNGGEGTAGLKRSDETRAKMSAAAKMRAPRTEEQIRHHAMMLTGRRQSREQVENRIAKVKGQKRTPEQCERIGAALRGIKRTEEQKRRLSVAHLGIKSAPKTEDGKRRISEARKAYWVKWRLNRALEASAV